MRAAGMRDGRASSAKLGSLAPVRPSQRAARSRTAGATTLGAIPAPASSSASSIWSLEAPHPRTVAHQPQPRQAPRAAGRISKVLLDSRLKNPDGFLHTLFKLGAEALAKMSDVTAYLLGVFG